MENKTSFLGIGWSFPPEFDKPNKTVVMTSDALDIKKSLEILLSTKLGERIMQPTYGCNLEELMFKSLNLTLKTFVVDLIKTAILYHEHRIDVEKIDIDTTNELQGELLILLNYRIKVTNSRANLVFPFYKAEGTEI